MFTLHIFERTTHLTTIEADRYADALNQANTLRADGFRVIVRINL